MSKAQDVIARAREFLAQASLEDNLRLFNEAEQLVNDLNNLPASKEGKPLKVQLDSLVAQYFKAAYKRLLSRAMSGEDVAALDVVARIVNNDEETFSQYFRTVYRVERRLERLHVIAAQKVLESVYSTKATPASWQHILVRAEKGIVWALNTLRDAVLSNTAEFRTKDEWTRVTLVLAKRLHKLELKELRK